MRMLNVKGIAFGLCPSDVKADIQNAHAAGLLTYYSGGTLWSPYSRTTMLQDNGVYRAEVPEVKYVPWTSETAEAVMLRQKLWHKYDAVWCDIITNGIEYKQSNSSTREVSFKELLDKWETRDGRPCGTLVEEQ